MRTVPLLVSSSSDHGVERPSLNEDELDRFEGVRLRQDPPPREMGTMLVGVGVQDVEVNVVEHGAVEEAHAASKVHLHDEHPGRRLTDDGLTRHRHAFEAEGLIPAEVARVDEVGMGRLVEGVVEILGGARPLGPLPLGVAGSDVLSARREVARDRAPAPRGILLPLKILHLSSEHPARDF